MADQVHGAFDLCAEGEEQFGLIAQRLLYGTGPRGGLAVPDKVRGNHPVTILQAIDECQPLPVAADRAVEKDDRLALTIFGVVDRYTAL